MKKTIYFVRHGQTADNFSRTHQSSASSQTELGLKQSAFIADRLAKLPVEALIASPFVRTRQTADIIAQKIGKVPEYLDMFAESRGIGRFEGVPESDEAAAAGYAAIRANYGVGFRQEDEETYEEHTARAKAALSFLAGRPEECIAVVTHSVFLRILLAHIIFDLEPSAKEIQKITWHLDAENTGLTIVTYDSERSVPWKLSVWNDHAHLG